MSDSHLKQTINVVEKAFVVALRRDRGSTRGLLERIAPASRIFSILSYYTELSDDPAVHAARQHAFELMRNEILENIGNGQQVCVDGCGLREDQANNLCKLASKAYVSAVKLNDLPSDLDSLAIRITKSPTNNKLDCGPFDIIGDVHGCSSELVELLHNLGYATEFNRDSSGQLRCHLTTPPGRRLAFVGDIVDRGPDPTGCLALVMDSVQAGLAIWVPGNHDCKLLNWLKQRKTKFNHGFDITVQALLQEPGEFRERLLATLESLPSHMVLDKGDLVLAHAGCKEIMQGKDSTYLTTFCLYGALDGVLDSTGYPVREDWAADYHGHAMVVHGHTAVAQPLWNANCSVVCIDTACCFGGSLTAFRWPEKEFVNVPARKKYFVHPVLDKKLTKPEQGDELKSDTLENYAIQLN